MRAYIKKIQSKDEETRKLILVGSLIVCMSFVSFIWIYNLGTRFSSPSIKTQTSADIKPFKLFSNSISDTYNSVSASVGKISPLKDTVTNEVNLKQEKQIDLIPVENPINQ